LVGIPKQTVNGSAILLSQQSQQRFNYATDYEFDSIPGLGLGWGLGCGNPAMPSCQPGSA